MTRQLRGQPDERRLSLGMGRAPSDSLVFARWDGSTRAPHWLTQKFALAMDALSIDCTLHALRRTHVSQLIAAGMDILTIMRMESDDPADIKKPAGCSSSCIPASIEHAHRCHRRQAVRLEGNPPAAARIDPKRTLDLPHRGVLRVAIPNPFSSKTGFRRERRGVVRVLIEVTHPVDPCAEAIPRYCRPFLLATYQLQASAFIIGDTYEKWKKETRLDIRTGPRTEVDGAQESTGGKNSQEAKTI